MSGTTIRQWMAVLIVGLSCGLAGWSAGRAHGANPSAADGRSALAADTAAPHTLFSPGPTIAVARDGRVTLHVDGESLEWVLAEIDRQAGTHVARTKDAPTDADHGAAPREAPRIAATAASREDVGARVMRGTETERFETLMQAQNGGAVSEDMLKTLYQTDASPRVRLLAFEYAQEGTEGDPAARRAELEAARLLPDAVVAQEAGRRLAAMDIQARHAAPQVATQR